MKLSLITMLVLASLLHSAPVRAELTAIAFFSSPKQTEKARTRWTLGSWLRQKETMRLQDLWLAKNSPSPWEVIAGADVRRNSESEGPNDRRLNFSIHRRRFGAGAERETRPNRWNAIFFGRIFGFHQQSTMITLQAGRQIPDRGPDAWFAGGQANLYLLQFLGVEGTYRRIFAEGGPWNQTEWNAFLELGFLRIYAGRLSQPGDSGHSSGYHAGARLYF